MYKNKTIKKLTQMNYSKEFNVKIAKMECCREMMGL